MKKARVLSILFVLLAVAVIAEAQQPKKVPRIGYLDNSTAAGSAELIGVFRKEMIQLGWVEGRNITVEYRFGEGKGSDQLANLAAEIVRIKPDVIVVPGTSEAWAAKKATSTIPIVMAAVSDPVGQGLIASLAQPRGNITGLASLAAELGGKG